MKRIYLLFVLSLLGIQFLAAQTRFQRAIGNSSDERNYHLVATKGGNFVATGYTDDISGNGDDAFLVKYNNLGGVEWAQTYGSTGDDYSWDLITTQNSDIVGVGYTTSFGTPKNTATITRTDSTGDVLWLTGVYHLSYGVEFYRVIETKSGHLLATGLMQSASKKDEIVLAKFTKSGQFLWAKTIGSSATDEAMGLIETVSGHYLLAGLSEDANGNGGSDFAVVKTDTAGRVIWSKLYGGSQNERLNTVVESRRWFYFIGWSSSVGTGENDVVMLRTDTAGAVVSVNAYGSSRNDLSFNAVVDDHNHVMIAGYTDAFSSAGQSDNRNSFLMQVDLFSERMGWSQTYGGSKRDGHWPTGLAQTWREEGFFLLGSTQSYGAGEHDMYLIRTDTAGDAGCNTKSGNFKRTKVTGWSAKSFGTSSAVSLTSSSSTLAGSTWAVKEAVECCELAIDSFEGDTLCPGTNQVFGIRSTGLYAYQWSKDGVAVGTSNSYRVFSGEGGAYQLRVSTKVRGCSAKTTSFNVYDDIAPQITPKTARICAGDTVQLKLQGGFETNAWYSERNRGQIDTGRFARTSMTDTIYTNSETEKGCKYRDSMFLTVLEYPVLTVRDTFSHCMGDSTLLTAQSDFNYFWDMDSQAVNANLWTRGSKYVQVTSINEFCAKQDSIWVAERPNPTPQLMTDTMVCGPDSICLSVSGKGLTSYWNNSRTPFDTFCNTLDTVVTLAVYNQWGCIGRDTALIQRVDPVRELFGVDTLLGKDSVQLNISFGTSFQWMGPDLSNDTLANPWAYSTGWYSVWASGSDSPCMYHDSVYVDFGTGALINAALPGFDLYPVPTKGMLHVRATSAIERISVYSLQGQLLSAVQGMRSTKQSIDIAVLPQGTYLLEVVHANGNSSRQLVLKK